MSSRGANSSRDRKIGLSCAECRRSKLRCDRGVPCQTCVRRGCASLCPDGILPAVKGSALLSVQMKDLQEQLKLANLRISELESELDPNTRPRSGPSSVIDPGPSNLTMGQRSVFRDGIFDGEPISEKLGALGVGDYGQTLFHTGSTAGGSEYLQGLMQAQKRNSQTFQHPLNPAEFGLPSSMLALVFVFPFGHPALPLEITIESFVHFLPPYETAMSLVNSYYDKVSWMYEPISKEDLMRNIVSHLYPKSASKPLWNNIHPHQLSIFFTLLACSYVDGSSPSIGASASRYLTLATAAFSLAPIIRESSCWTVIALQLIILLLYWRDRTGGEQRYLLSGICQRIALRIGLQRDSTSWNLDYEETQRRLIAFWEMYTYELFVSMVFGRPPPFNLQHVDAPFPAEIGQLNSSGNMELSFMSWKHRYMATCFTKCAEKVFSTNVPDYPVLMQLDREIRDFQVPSSLRWPSVPLNPDNQNENNKDVSWSPDPVQAMRQYFVLCVKESTIFYVHRGYVGLAIKRDPGEPLNNRYGASIVACYKSACALTSTLQSLCEVHGEMASTVWYFWCGIFSASIILGGLVIESPGCTLSAGALWQLDQAIALFSKASENCCPPSTINVLYQLQRKAHVSFEQHHSSRNDNGFSQQNTSSVRSLINHDPSHENHHSLDLNSDPKMSRRWDLHSLSHSHSMQSYQSDAMAMFGLPLDSDMDLLMKTISDRPSPPSQDNPTLGASGSTGPQANNMRPLFPMSEERSNGFYDAVGIPEQQAALRYNTLPQQIGAPSAHYNQLENWQTFLGGLGIDQLQSRLPLF